MRKQKGVLLTVLPSVIFVMTCFLAILAMMSIEENPTNNQDIVGSVYAFSEETISSVDYNRYEEFEVNSEEGYISFVKSTWANSTIGMVATSTTSSGYDYAGKVIKQTKDLDLSHVDNIVIDVFAGTYDGQGHELKLGANTALAHKETASGVTPLSEADGSGDVYYAGGFCNILEGTLTDSIFFVTGTRIEDIYAKGDNVFLGSLAGLNNGVISSQAVASLYYDSNIHSQTHFSIGIIAGYNKGIVQYCIVTGGNMVTIRLVSGYQSYLTFNVFVGGGDPAQYCLSEITSSKLIYNMLSGDDQTVDNPDLIDLSVGSNNANSYVEIYKFPSEAASTEGGSNHTSGWYLYPSGYYYNDDARFPARLRSSMQWSTIKVEISPSAAAKEVDDSGRQLCYISSSELIYVPKAHLDRAKSTFTQNWTGIEIFNQSRSAVCKSNSMYLFDSWDTSELESNDVIKAIYKLREFTIKFVENGRCSYDTKSGEPVGFEYTVTALTKILITSTPYAKTGYRVLQFSFGNEVVTYEISDSKYYIASSNIGVSLYCVVKSDLTISVLTQFKTYNISFS